jgi:hypothetical protein
MPTGLDDRIARLAAHLAYSRNIPRKTAERTVRKLVDETWAEERELGAPFGDDDAGLARWIVERAQRVKAG